MHALILDHIQHVNFDLSGSRKVKFDSVTGLPIYGFLLMCNSNVWPKSATLRDISFRNLSDLDFNQGQSGSNVTVSLDSPYMLSR